MSILKFKAKVRLVSEEDMELEEMDMGIIAKSKEWVWRARAVPVEEIYSIIAYSSTKSIVQMYDGEKILLAESFEEVCARWERSRIELQLSEEYGLDYNLPGESFKEDDNS